MDSCAVNIELRGIHYRHATYTGTTCLQKAFYIQLGASVCKIDKCVKECALLLSASDIFCLQLITFTNSLDQDQE